MTTIIHHINIFLIQFRCPWYCMSKMSWPNSYGNLLVTYNIKWAMTSWTPSEHRMDKGIFMIILYIVYSLFIGIILCDTFKVRFRYIEFKICTSNMLIHFLLGSFSILLQNPSVQNFNRWIYIMNIYV